MAGAIGRMPPAGSKGPLDAALVDLRRKHRDEDNDMYVMQSGVGSHSEFTSPCCLLRDGLSSYQMQTHVLHHPTLQSYTDNCYNIVQSYAVALIGSASVIACADGHSTPSSLH